jgi:hypothetical protein
MTFAQMANQISGYGITEAPGTAYAYNDWQMALFFDTLMLKVHGSTWETVDQDVLRPLLADRIQCQDRPSFMAFGQKDRPGRLAVSPRDFARFAWLYLNEGNWNGTQVIPAAWARRAVSDPLPATFPRTTAVEANMLPGQRTLGSGAIPDDQTDHLGSYSWLWWLNGVDRNGNRFWPSAPVDTFTALGHANGKRGVAALPSLDLVIAWNDTSLDRRPGVPHPLDRVFELLCEAAADAPVRGQVMRPSSPAPGLVRNLDGNGDGKLDPVYLAGPGDPEGFLYRGTRRPDGTRDGDQQTIIDRLSASGANCLYIQAIRSHGGDGADDHNPFVDHAPNAPLNEHILQQWEGWFRQLDRAGVTVLFFLYDDSSRAFPDGDTPTAAEVEFVRTLVNRFEHHRNWIWCIAEEYNEFMSPGRVKALARLIREHDEHNHPIAVHKLHGLDFTEFADTPEIDVFAVQYNESDLGTMHAGLVKARREAGGRYAVLLTECADHGTGDMGRRRNWAAAMAGTAACMALGWSFDDPVTPSDDDLRMCGVLRTFLESLDWNRFEPADERAEQGCTHVMAGPEGSLLVYCESAGDRVRVGNATNSTWNLTWCDTESGRTLVQGTVETDRNGWGVPPEFRNRDVAVHAVPSAR